MTERITKTREHAVGRAWAIQRIESIEAERDDLAAALAVALDERAIVMGERADAPDDRASQILALLRDADAADTSAHLSPDAVCEIVGAIRCLGIALREVRASQGRLIETMYQRLATASPESEA